jgi:hypothetical protein
MQSKAEIINTAIRILDEAYAADEGAIHALICNRVPCNQSLADHAHVVVDVTRPQDTDIFAVGMLGIVNDILDALTGLRVAVQFDDAIASVTEDAEDPAAADPVGFPASLAGVIGRRRLHFSSNPH